MSDDLRKLRQLVSKHRGGKLPTERDLVSHLGISRPRLRILLDQLEKENLIRRRQGSGTFALSPEEGALNRVVLLIDAALKLGDDPFFSRLVECLQSELQRATIQCFIQRTERAPSMEELRIPVSDGIVALGMSSLQMLHQLKAHTPAVGLFAAADAQCGKSVSLLQLDEEDAGTKAARHLIERGVRRATFFGRRSLSAVNARLVGIERELRRVNIPLTVVECGLNYGAGMDAALQFRAPRSAALHGVIAANDWLAVGLHTGLQSRDAALRRRLEIVSFDGLPFARRPELGIASLAVPIETMARDAVSELRRLKQENSGERAIRYALNWPEESSGAP